MIEGRVIQMSETYPGVYEPAVVENAPQKEERFRFKFLREFAAETFWVYAVAALAVVVLNAVWPLISK